MARVPVLLVVLALLIGIGSTSASELPAASSKAPERWEKVLGELEALLSASKTPGMSLAVVTPNGVVHTGGLGLADVAQGVPATATTLFRIGSTSKAFVALAALKLQAEGRLDFNATLASLAPEIAFSNRWEATDPVRVIHLLEHTTGFDDLHLRDYANQDARPNNLLEALAYTPASRRCRWRPGTRYAYCNSGPPIVALIIEKITGEAFEDYVQREFFAPIGMTGATYFEPPKDANAAQMYAGDGITPYDYWHISVRPSGAINASANDMAAYVRFLLDRGRAGGIVLLEPAQIEAMERPRSTTAARAGLRAGYGLYNYSTPDEDGRLWQGHGGGVQGGRCDMSYLPEAGAGYALMINSSDDALMHAASRLVRRFLAQGLPKPEKPAVRPLPADTAARYAGYYVPVSPRVKLRGTLDRVTNVMRWRAGEEGVRFNPLVGLSRPLVGVTENLLRYEHRVMPSMVLLEPTEKDGAHLVADGQSYRRVPVVVALAPPALFVAAGLAMASTLVFLPVWVVRGIRGSVGLREDLGLRLWPLVTTLAFGCLLFQFRDLANDPRVFQNYGNLTVRSLALAVFSILAILLSWAGLAAVWRSASRRPRRLLRIHARSVMSILALLTLYLVAAGTLPLFSWR